MGHGVIARALTAVALMLMTSACAIVDDDRALPGNPCKSDSDCGGALVCAPSTSGGRCAPSAGGVQPVVGCGDKNDGDSCSDGDACTEHDACASGVCHGAAKQCGQDQACESGACVDLGQCTLSGAVARVTTTGSASGAGLAYDSARDDLALVYEDTISGRSEIYFQLLDDTGTGTGPAIQLTHGEADNNGVEHPSSQPSIAYAPEQQEFGVVFGTLGLLIANDATAMTVTANGVPATSHTITLGEGADGPVIAWTGATYGEAWVNGATDDAGDNLNLVEFAALKADGSKASFNNKTISAEGAGFGIGIAFNARTASFGIVYRLDPSSLVLTTTNVDGDAPVDTNIPSAGAPFQPEIAVTPSGYAIAYQDDPAGTGLGVIKLALVSDGLVASAPVEVSDADEQCGRPALVATATGLALAYAAQNASGSLEVRLRILASDGSSAPFSVLGPGQRPSLAAQPTGASAAYPQLAGTSSSDIFAASSCLVSP